MDGTQLFIAEVYQSSSASQPIARAGVRIIDTADEFQIVCYITSSNKEVDTGQPVTVSAKIVNMTTGSTYTPTSASWTMDVMDKENWKSLKHSTTNSISVTTTETDRNGTQYDVDVWQNVILINIKQNNIMATKGLGNETLVTSILRSNTVLVEVGGSVRRITVETS